MRLRFGNFYEGGFYHVYNRGVDKRVIFTNRNEVSRFLFLLEILNSTVNVKNLGNLLKGEGATNVQVVKNGDPLVVIHAFAVMKNHYHLVLEQVSEDGVSRFMHKLGTAYTKYFNAKHERVGALFQGKFKYGEITDDRELMRVVCYVNNNLLIHHTNRSPTSFCSGDYYDGLCHYDFCVKKFVLNLFNSRNHYKRVSEEVVSDVIRRRNEEEIFLE